MEKLSQNEIDDLLNSMLGGAGASAESVVESEVFTDKRKVVKYDFSRATKFNKEHLRTLEMIFDNYSRLASSFLTGYLRATATVEVAHPEQGPYFEFTNALVNPIIFGVANLHPLKGSVIIELSSKIGYAIIDRILGGQGIELKKLRDFSEIEKILIDRVVSQLLLLLVEPWANVVELRPRLDRIETNSQFAQIIPPNDPVSLITLNVKVGPVEGYINFCIPFLVIEPIVNMLNTQFWYATVVDDDSDMYKGDIENRLERTDTLVSAVIGKTYISVNDFINLQTGDIIPLDSYVNSDLDIYVGSLLKFHGKPGTSRGKNAVQITERVGKEE